MGYITKYGSFWGFLPQTTGRIFWVAPSDTYTVEGRTYSASDNAALGLSPETALRTVDYAVGLCTANVGDVIVLLPGSHSISATIAVDVAGLTIVGIPGSAPSARLRGSPGGAYNRSRITSTETAGIIFTVTAVDTEIAYLHLAPPAAGGQAVTFSNAADRGYVHDCTIAMVDTASVTTYGVHFTLGTGTTVNNDNTIIRNCYFLSGGPATSGANGPAIFADGTTIGLKIESSTFELQGTAAWADAINITLVSLGTLIRDCDFVTPTNATTVMTDCIDTTGATTNGSTQVYRCFFPEGSDAFEASVTLDITTSECYLSSSTGGALTGSI